MNCHGHKVTFRPPLNRGLDFFKNFIILIIKFNIMARKINSEFIVDNDKFKVKIYAKLTQTNDKKTEL